jgi:hypothetical protein
VDSTTGAHTVGTSGTTGTTGYGSSSTGTYGSGTAEGVAGPHNSRVANAADPRVDSDRDGSHHVGGTGAGYGSSNTHSTTGAGYGSTGYNGASTTTGTTNAGPHNSNVLNKLDPRVDEHATTTSAKSTGGHTGVPGTTGGLSSSTNAGPHDSNLANKADPRVDSDLDGRGNRTGASKGGVFGASGSHATAGSGTAQNTAGPHNSDLANKLDPRVDSDRDGSSTVGGNRTHA